MFLQGIFLPKNDHWREVNFERLPGYCIHIAYTLHTHCIHIDFVNSLSHQIKITLRCIKLMLLHLADFSSKTFIVANCGFWGG